LCGCTSGTVCALRIFSLLLNFLVGQNLNYLEITRLRRIPFLGQTISLAEGVSNPWMLAGQLSLVLFVVFVTDAAITVWRRGDRRQALATGGSIVFFVLAITVQAVLVLWEIIPWPLTASFFYTAIVAAMAYELSYDVLRAAQLTEAFRASEERFRDVTFSMADWVWEVDENGVYTYCSAKGLDLLGQVIGKRPFDFMPPDEARRVAAIFAEIASNKAPIKDLENWNITRSGEGICFLTNGIPILDEKGELKGYRGVDKDITRRKRMEEALKKSERLLAETGMMGKVGGWEIAVDTRRLTWTEETYNIHEVDTADEPTVEKGINFYTPDSRPIIEQAVRRAVEHGEPFDVELEIMTAKGNLRNVHARGKAASEGRVYGFFQDITERKALEARLRRSLEEVQQLRDRLHTENIYLRERLRRDDGHAEIVGESEPLLRTLAEAKRVAPTDSTVLILGETGTGKELLAHAIHDMSSRKDRMLVSVNCASLPPTLIESELFGREKGAYTGSLTKMVGRFELADGSTLFLDEIGDLSFELQSKLLRVLEHGQFERLGSSKTIKVNVRLIAATNRDLARDVNEGRFRKDLYYRLNVFPITLPPLRDRKEDIPGLVWSFVNRFEKSLGKRMDTISKKNMEDLMHYQWPGNIRELKNVIEHAMIMSTTETLDVQSPAGVHQEQSVPTNTLADSERRHIIEVLERTGWRISGKNGAAEILGMKRTTLQSKMKTLGIKRSDG
jgi:formate hydrogenlyase transcriptional activator